MRKVVKREYLLAKDLPDEALENNIIDATRWSVINEIIFEDEGRFWKTTYSEGATECQDESPWEYEPEVILIEVEKTQKMVFVWEEKN